MVHLHPKCYDGNVLCKIDGPVDFLHINISYFMSMKLLIMIVLLLLNGA
jgi:hypothetical protein